MDSIFFFLLWLGLVVGANAILFRKRVTPLVRLPVFWGPALAPAIWWLWVAVPLFMRNGWSATIRQDYFGVVLSVVVTFSVATLVAAWLGRRLGRARLL